MIFNVDASQWLKEKTQSHHTGAFQEVGASVFLQNQGPPVHFSLISMKGITWQLDENSKTLKFVGPGFPEDRVSASGKECRTYPEERVCEANSGHYAAGL